jgi:hypothetical protein
VEKPTDIKRSAQLRRRARALAEAFALLSRSRTVRALSTTIDPTLQAERLRQRIRRRSDV